MNQYPSNINNWLAAHVVFPFMNIGKIPGCFLQHKCSSSSSCLLVRMPSCLANFSHHLLLGRDNSKVCWPLSSHTRLQHHAALLKGTACKSSNSIWSCWTPPAVGYFDVTAKSHFVYIDFGWLPRSRVFDTTQNVLQAVLGCGWSSVERKCHGSRLLVRGIPIDCSSLHQNFPVKSPSHHLKP